MEDKAALMSFELIDDIIATGNVPDRYIIDSNTMESFLLRDRYTCEVSWCLISNSWINPLSDLLKGHKCLEIYGGLGLLSHRLKENGIDITCTDNKSFVNMDYSKCYTDVCNMSAIDAIRSFEKDTLDYVIASWIPYEDAFCESIARVIYQNHKNCKLIYIGEERGGCTATSNFFIGYDDISNTKEYKSKIKNINSNFQRWHRIYDYVMVLKPRNKTPGR